MTSPIPPLLRHHHTDEFAAPAWTDADRRALTDVVGVAERRSRSFGLDVRAYLEHRCGTAAALRAIDAQAGGGFYVVPAEAEHDQAAADDALGGKQVVIDVQTHLVRPSLMTTSAGAALKGFLRSVDPERWDGDFDASLLSAASWATNVFGLSETAVALLTSPPGRAHENVLTNDDIVNARDIVNRYAGTGRVLSHTIVHPNLGPSEREAMADWTDTLRPDGWKVYTLWEPPEASGRGGWFLDDDETGGPFLDAVRSSGRTIVTAHKGLGGPIANLVPAGASPRDVGPAAAANPDLTFVIYHSGFELLGARDGFTDLAGGVGRLEESLRRAGVVPGSNVYGELGSTWFLVARRPEEAAHVLGTLLRCVGEDRILWGTDSVWYGSPQSLIDAFRAFTIPERMQAEFGYPALTDRAKHKILSTNAAALYNVDLDAVRRPEMETSDWLITAQDELRARLA